MATQQPGGSEQKKSESDKNERVEQGEKGQKRDIEVKRGGEQGMERPRRGTWFGLPRWMRRGWQAPATPFSLDFSMSPFETMQRMADDLDRMITDFGFGPEGEQGYLTAGALWSPDIEVYQQGDELVVRADLPGVSKEDLRVELLDNQLVLEGERRQESERRGEGFYRSERSYGSFRRTIPLPEAARDTEPHATFENGVLEVRVKNPQTRGKRIEIKGGESPKIH